MSRFEVAPSIPAWEAHPEDYEALVAGLTERGIDASLSEPIPPAGGIPPAAAAGLDFAIHVVGEFEDAILALIVGEIVHRVVRARRQRREEVPVMGIIYGPDGEILRVVEFMPGELGE